MDIYKINFKKWLDEEDLDPDIKKELQSLKEELRASETNGAAGAESREKPKRKSKNVLKKNSGLELEVSEAFSARARTE